MSFRRGVEGLDEVLAQFDRLDPAFDAAALRASFEGGEYLLSLAIPLTPIDQGPLRQTALVIIDRDGNAVVFFPQPYAAAVHEGMTRKDGKPVKHKTGQAKFLEIPANQYADEIREVVRLALRREMGLQ